MPDAKKLRSTARVAVTFTAEQAEWLFLHLLTFRADISDEVRRGLWHVREALEEHGEIIEEEDRQRYAVPVPQGMRRFVFNGLPFTQDAPPSAEALQELRSREIVVPMKAWWIGLALFEFLKVVAKTTALGELEYKVLPIAESLGIGKRLCDAVGLTESDCAAAEVEVELEALPETPAR